MSTQRAALTESQRRRLDGGHHEQVATELAGDGRHELAAWVYEQIWDFERANELYLRGDAWLDALRVALEASNPAVTERTLQALEGEADAHARQHAVALLEHRGRHAEAARLLSSDDGDPAARAQALLRAGDRIAAARVLAQAGEPRDALEALGSLDERPAQAAALGLAATIAWELGDAEGSARHAQAALRVGNEDPAIASLLARALGTLGHDLAAQIVLRDRPGETEVPPVRGRYHVTGVLPATLAGAAYVGIDRVTLQEVELHLLLADFVEGETPDPAVREAISRFARAADAANELRHPAIRPIERIEEEDGLLVLPRAEGPTLRHLIRAPGMLEALPRARAMIAFLLEGLAAGHARGLVHGSILPSQVVCDALGRPLLGPFGVHHLAGLVATRTGGLEEVLSITAPERRAQADPSQASDVFSVGAIYAALLTGSIGEEASELPDDERELITAMTSAIPEQRPTAAEAFARVHVPVPDVSRVAFGGHGLPGESQRGRSPNDTGLGRAVVVTAAESWSDAMLDALCEARDPWLQTVLDRDARTFWLAAWPEGCRTLGASDWRPLVTNKPFEGLDDELANAIRSRMTGEAAVATPAGEVMIALDQILAR